ncbi:diguanylate phosphodiesterase [Candidatus Geothermarchaeota archaeon]|nr:MAG: diguanylate phosphodiesterase [Candidatus Geothermarchaeota archaeon]
MTDPKDLFTKGKDFMQMYNKVVQFTEELINKNLELRNRIKQLEEERRKLLAERGGEEEKRLQEKIEHLKKEKQELLNRYREVSEETQDFLERYREIEQENNNLANLYVASYQLHSTLDFNEVLEIITEIIINLIGAGKFVIFLHNEKQGSLKPVKAEGLPLEEIPTVKLGEGIIGGAGESGEIYYRESEPDILELDLRHPMVCVPMKVQERLVGVIAVYQLLPQKEKLEKVDYELFSLLAAHAATALFSARLYSESVRKRETIKGFLDLITH